jgi:hypothetical protein
MSIVSPHPKLEVFQSLWAMQLRRTDGYERGHEENLELIAGAGFDGIGIDLSAMDIGTARNLKPLIARYGLGVMLTTLPMSFADFRDALHLARDLDVRFLNVICQIMPVQVSATVPVVLRLAEMAEDAHVEMHLETHRNSVTNDLFVMLQLLDALPDLLVSADLSHYVTAREFYLPLPARTQEQIRRVLDRAESFQGRVASHQQIQVQLDFPQHRPWVDLFLRWWREGFRLWRDHRRDRVGSTLNFLCELGPPEYAITDAHGNELSDRWVEAQTIRNHALAIWEALEREAGTAPA